MVFLTLLIYHGVGRRASERTRTYPLSTLLRNTIRSVHHGTLFRFSSPPSFRLSSLRLFRIFARSNDADARNTVSCIERLCFAPFVHRDNGRSFYVTAPPTGISTKLSFWNTQQIQSFARLLKRYTRTLYSRIRSPPLFFSRGF